MSISLCFEWYAFFIACAAGAIGYVFPRTCAGEKHDDPPILPQQNGETAPQRGPPLVEEMRQHL